jgi:hypothetical protein
MIRLVGYSHSPTRHGLPIFRVEYEAAVGLKQMFISAQDAIEAKQIASALLEIPFRMYG